MERERKAGAARVSVTVPGAVRGFDAMTLETLYGRQYILEAIDASVPYRTSLDRVDRYDGDSVAVALDRDFRQHGAPLVLRLDRASAHRVAAVLDVCKQFGVVVLHGPPHLPRFYGQLERQNREHRDWLQTIEIRTPTELTSELERMRTRLNELKPRRTLGWDTAAERWSKRTDFGCRNAVERLKFGRNVAMLSDRVVASLRDREPYDGFAHGLAVQAALIQSGLLRLSRTGRC
jgi:transposase InsO family protein